MFWVVDGACIEVLEFVVREQRRQSFQDANWSRRPMRQLLLNPLRLGKTKLLKESASTLVANPIPFFLLVKKVGEDGASAGRECYKP
jgi:hypothetical protein